MSAAARRESEVGYSLMSVSIMRAIDAALNSIVIDDKSM